MMARITDRVIMSVPEASERMVTLRNRLLAIGGIVIGAITFRAWRQRRATAESDAVDHSDVETATDHAVAASEHARLATKKAIGKQRER